ncbi:MAG: hypothetical protein KGJ57_08230 [Sphingomonadales bacterium]|nr:hypothetical protein [Sphingomonadales bacterium]MDE2169401.1 hypothetical protein [Sphingomonadales bacterium]
MDIASALPPVFRLAFQNPQLSIWTTAAMPAIPLGKRGVVVGQVFSGLNPAVSIDAFDDSQARMLFETNGEVLVSHYWGAYAAFLWDPAMGHIRIIRDPSPGFPLYHAALGDHVVIATHVDDLVLLGFKRPSVDFTYLAAHLQNSGLRYRRTALTGVDELPPGEALLIDGPVRRHAILWSPWTFAARERQIEDTATCAAMVRSTIDATVLAWSSCYDHAVLGVSGGLDSSIVASALAQAEIDLSLINLLGFDGSLGDERHFVRALAKGLGREIEIVQDAVTYVDMFHSDGAHLPRPVARAFAQSGSLNTTETARRNNADVIFSGGGGDNVFCFLQTSAPVADCFLSGQGPMAVLTTARNIGQVSGAGVGKVLLAAFRRLRHRHPRWMWKPNRDLLSEACHDLAFDIESHPWLMAEHGRLPGKLEHVGLLAIVLNALEGFGYERDWPVIYPLLSQPVVELCLRIPTWLWCEGGINRAIARCAYRDALPKVTIQRRSKGTFDRLGIELIERHRATLQEFLCGGALAGAGLIKPDAVREAIGGMASYQDLTWSRILTLVDVEAWTRARS